MINTIPYNIIPETAFKLQNEPYVLDIASSPFGIDKNISKKYPNYKIYSGIPSVFAPKKAADILLEVLNEEINIQ